jgi:methylmalonyl-CoA mutase
VNRLEEAAVVLMSASSGRSQIMERIIDAVRQRVTVGEISGALEKHWGRHDAQKH